MEEQLVLTDGSTAIQGLFAAGNATRGIQMAMIAAAEGLKAGAAINCWLTDAEQSYLANPEGARHEAAGISVR